ncbi:ABC transporter ATP-binding protein [Allonocardiopsis opalescens]|uniref:ATP-binding cassette subfamily B protein n=1 Tax=Allonocardiopsis opalescens TaxID=1144618 RepID=A0A2T0Q014_9ACTN|nr:ABC transporter ATP-binding protein [Allonocardiopsis opalescens]PRX97130.1 ATP-binding cassette subfamily B protein [Allonocardiopsis opalescens]
MAKKSGASAPEQLREALPGLRRTLGYLRPHMRDQRLLIGGGFVALFAEVAFRLLEPWPLKFVIDTVVAPAAAGQPGVVRVLLLCAGALIAVAALRALSAYLMTVAFALVGNRVMTRVRAQLFGHLNRLSLRYHRGSRLGDLISRLTGDVGRLQEVAVTAALPLVGNVVTLVGMSVVMLVLDWRLAVFTFVAFPVFIWFGSRDSRRINTAARRQRKREGELAGSAAESLGAITVVQAYGLEPLLQRRFDASNDQTLTEGVRTTRLSAGLERRTDLLVGVATAVVILAGGYAALLGQLTPGELVVFVSYLKGAFKPMRDMAKYTGRIAKAAASGERIVDVLRTEPDITDRPGATPAMPWQGDIRFENVSAGHTEDRLALRDVNVHIPARARVGIVGPSGSGKSTLAALLPRLIDPAHGRVVVDGRDVRDLTLDSVRSQIAIVLQESVLFATSVRDNIRSGRPGATDEEVEWAARAANAHDFILRLPEGYDTVLGERGATLSGGQRQRIAIARAIVRQASIVVLDEATTGLDPTTEREVTAALAELTRDRTTLVISHDLDAVADCDMVLSVYGGRVRTLTPAELAEATATTAVITRGGLHAHRS